VRLQRVFRLMVTLAAAVASPALGQSVHRRARLPLALRKARPQSRICPAFGGIPRFPILSRLSSVPPGDEQLAAEGYRRQQLRPAGRGSYQSDLATMGGGSREEKGELSLAGVTYPNPANQCWPEPMPFIYKNFGIGPAAAATQVTILYEQDHEFRKVRSEIRLHRSHPACELRDSP